MPRKQGSSVLDGREIPPTPAPASAVQAGVSMSHQLAGRIFAAPTPAESDEPAVKAKGVDIAIVDDGEFYNFRIPKTIPLDNVQPCQPKGGKPSNFVYTVLRANPVSIGLSGVDPTTSKPAIARFVTKPFAVNLMIKVS